MANVNSTVTWRGDAAQLLATYKTIGAASENLAKQIQTVNNLTFKALGLNQAGKNPSTTGGDQGKIIHSTRVEADALNNTFRTFGTTAIRTKKYGDLLVGSFQDVKGNIANATAAAERLDTALGKTGGFHTQLSAIRQQTQATIQQAEALRQSRKYAAGTIGPNGNNIGGQFGQTQAQADATFAATVQQAQLNARNAIAPLRAAYAPIAAEIRSADADIRKALLETPPIPKGIQNLGALSPNLLGNLQKQGLGVTPAQLYAQQAEVNLEKDLVRQTTQVGVSFRDSNGILQKFSGEIDKSGKSITRFGSNLSGLQSFLTQSVRNLQKVVQWGVATTAVFGSLALATHELTVLTELNTNMNRLGITANLTRSQTNDLFNSLADVATKTATPLNELTKSADDIALAVRQVGKPTQDLTRDILNLSEAVGIYTNLTGTDTVQATDILVSSMKQLGLGTEDVVGLLSKITAVAGGQSNAISDISEGLAAMAEAAKQAGLSVDETISTVQVLSQVTNKSSSEIATSFKNLVGALDSRAGAKALAQFGIGLRDEATGQLKNIITVYGEIADKIRQGIIPADQVKGLVKAIAGGPRRAPDAAALLSAVGQIQAGVEKSLRATNEALIVNAKILDTTQAKLVQLQNAFDTLVFKKFGEAFRSLVETLVTGLTGLIGFLNKIPTGLITAGLQIAIFITALRLGVGAVRLLAGVIGQLGLALAQIPAKAALAAASIKGVGVAAQSSGLVGVNGQPLASSTGAATGSAGSRLLSALGGKGNLGSIALSGGLGAVAGGAAGGDLKSIVSGGLSGVGAALLFSPATLVAPWAKVAGAVALAAGTVLSFVGNTNKAADAEENAAQKAESILNAYNAYGEALASVQGLKKGNDVLALSIDKLENNNHKNADDLAQLADFQTQYIDNAIAMASANQQLAKSFDDINKLDSTFAAAIQAAQQGRLSKDALEQYVEKYQLKLLQQTNPNAVLPNGGIEKPVFAPIVPAALTDQFAINQRNQAILPGHVEQVPFGPKDITGLQLTQPKTVGQSNLDLNSLQKTPQAVKNLFADGKLTAQFQITSENIGLITDALKALKEAGDPAADALITTFTAFTKGASAVDGANIVLASFQNRIDALKNFAPEAAAQFQKLKDLAEQGIGEASARGDEKTVFDLQSRLADIISGNKVATKDEIEPILLGAAKAMGLLSDKTLSATQIGLKLDEVAKAAGLDFEFLPTAAKNALDLAGAIADTSTALEKLDSDTLASVAQRTAELQAKLQGGEFKGNSKGYQAQSDELTALAASVHKVTAAYENANTAMQGQLEPSFKDVEESLNSINGLQDATSLSTTDLIGRLFSLADTYGLTGKEVTKLGDKIIHLIGILNTIAKIKVKFPIVADLDLKDAIKKLKAVQAAQNALLGQSGGAAHAGATSNPELANAIAALEKAQKDIGGTTGDISTLYKQGHGSAGVGGSSAKAKAKAAGLDVSTLDLPDQIAQSTNANSLIAQAVKNAKALQAKIPGAGKDAKNDVVEILNGTKRVLEVRGVKEDLLRKALDELAAQVQKQNDLLTKADTIRRIRVGAGSFGAIANVPVNSQSGVSVGGPNGPINVSLNLNGTVLTPAQFAQFADMVAAALKRQLAQ